MIEWLIALILAVCSAAQADAPAQRESLVGLVGDSITAENQDAIAQELQRCGAPPVVIDAEPGRITLTSDTPFGIIPSGVSAVAAMEAEVDPDTWVIELGVNDVNVDAVNSVADATAVIDAVLAEVEPDDRVIWVDTYTVHQPADSALFNSVVRSDPRIEWINWADNAEPYLYDGLHPTEAGARWMAQQYCDALR